MNTNEARKQAREKIANFLRDNPDVTYQTLADQLDCSVAAIGKLATQFKVRRYRKALSAEDAAKLEGVK